MKQFWVYLILSYLALAVQAVFFKGIKPDLALVLVCFYAVKNGQVKGVAFGALTGLLMDTASGFILGPNILSKSLIALLAGVIRENLYQWNIIISTIVIAVLSVIDIFIVYICFETFSKMSFANRHWGISIKEVIYTVVSAMILYSVFNREKERGLL